jgi:hypothetical protein
VHYNFDAEAAQALRDAFGHKNLVARRKRFYVTCIGFRRRSPPRRPFVVSIFKVVTVAMRVAA